MSSAEPDIISELYSAYAAGRLSTAFALMVETQAALRRDIERDLACSDAIAGAMLEREQIDRLAPNGFEKALQAIDALPESEDEALRAGTVDKDAHGFGELLDLPEPLRSRAMGACVQTGWRRLTGGVSRLDLGDNSAIHAHLYRIRPGCPVPRHSHRGDELTLVLRGGFSDETGSYGPGDVSRQTPRNTHQPVADEDGDCLAFAVSEGGMRFTGMLGFVQKLSGR